MSLLPWAIRVKWSALSFVQSILERRDQDIHAEWVPVLGCSWGVNREAEVWYSTQSTSMSTGEMVYCPSNYWHYLLLRSIRTVRRQMTEYDLSVHGLYTQLTDQQLDGLSKPKFPTCVNWQKQGHQL